jgi:hypothetical protein
VPELREVIERAEPEPDVDGDWKAVLRDAGVRRRRALVPVGGLALAVLALVALMLFQPWSRESPTLLERALAEVDDGPVLHVVLRGDWGGTNVDLETGERSPVHGESEIWYDAERQLIHSLSRLGETVIHDSVDEAAEAPPELVALGRDYRRALQSGSARIAGEDVIDGERVTWIVVRRELLPDTDGLDHEWTQQVAVSNETFRPVATRDTRDGREPVGTRGRVLELETLAAGEGDFTGGSAGTGGGAFNGGRRPIGLERAAGVLGRRPVWLGQEHAGLALAEVSETYLREGRQRRIEITGEEAEDIRACTGRPRGSDLRTNPDCASIRERRGGVEVRLGKVYALGPIEWKENEVGLELFYGTTGDDKTTYRKDDVPLTDRPHVTITEWRKLPAFVQGGAYLPPEGSVFLAAGGSGTVRADGLAVVIQASSRELILSAAGALEPMP